MEGAESGPKPTYAPMRPPRGPRTSRTDRTVDPAPARPRAGCGDVQTANPMRCGRSDSLQHERDGTRDVALRHPHWSKGVPCLFPRCRSPGAETHGSALVRPGSVLHERRYGLRDTTHTRGGHGSNAPTGTPGRMRRSRRAQRRRAVRISDPAVHRRGRWVPRTLWLKQQPRRGTRSASELRGGGTQRGPTGHPAGRGWDVRGSGP